jgi:hypothetical protein
LGEHVNELVFAAIDAKPQQRSREQIVAETEMLLEEVEGDDARSRWLRAQVRAVLAIAREEQLPFEEEVAVCFGIEPRPIAEEELRAAHGALDEALPGEGALAERYERWLDRNMVAGEEVADVLRAVTGALRERARELVGLPEGEEIEVEVVTGERWVAFSRYLGNRRSRFSYNADLPLPAVQVPHLAAHEAYPGHHTEDTWKDVVLVGEEGRVEFSLMLAVGIQPVIAEGIAELGAELLADRETHALVGELEPHYDAETGFRVADAWRRLSGVSANLAILHAGGSSREELTDYAREWSLQPPDRVAKSIRSLETRPFRGSPFCYTEGLRLCRQFAGRDPARFRRLLTEQLTLDDLRA